MKLPKISWRETRRSVVQIHSPPTVQFGPQRCNQYEFAIFVVKDIENSSPTPSATAMHPQIISGLRPQSVQDRCQARRSRPTSRLIITDQARIRTQRKAGLSPSVLGLFTPRFLRAESSGESIIFIIKAATLLRETCVPLNGSFLSVVS
jgi:hypothetical protein